MNVKFVPEDDDIAGHDNGSRNLDLLALVPKNGGVLGDLGEGGREGRKERYVYM